MTSHFRISADGLCALITRHSTMATVRIFVDDGVSCETGQPIKEFETAAAGCISSAGNAIAGLVKVKPTKAASAPFSSPPAIPGLKWKPAADSRWSAKYGTTFVFDYDAGVPRPECVHTDGAGTMFIPVTPSAQEADEIDAWRVGIVAALAAKEELKAIVRKRHHNYAGPRHAENVRAAIKEGWDLYIEHGVAIRKVTPLLKLLRLVYLQPFELKQLRKLLREMHSIVDNLEDDAKRLAKTVDVHLDDDFVERAVRLLTDLDQDMRTEPNKMGWGGQTGAPGHWCCALLETDRARAIALGRGLVAHHLGQLAKLGVVPSAERKAA